MHQYAPVIHAYTSFIQAGRPAVDDYQWERHWTGESSFVELAVVVLFKKIFMVEYEKVLSSSEHKPFIHLYSLI